MRRLIKAGTMLAAVTLAGALAVAVRAFYASGEWEAWVTGRAGDEA